MKPQAPNDPSEKDFQASVVELAHLHRWLVYHTHDARRSEAGFPDLVLVRARSSDSAIIFAELKTDTGIVSPVQSKWLDALRLVGNHMSGRFFVCVWRPRDFAEIERVLRLGPSRHERPKRAD